MRNLFKGFLSLLLVITMIFTMGIESISINNPILADTREEVMEAPPVALIEEQSNKKDLEVAVPNHKDEIEIETKDPQEPIESSRPKEEIVEKPERDNPTPEENNSEKELKEEERAEEDEKKESGKELVEETKEKHGDEIEDIKELEGNEAPELEELKVSLVDTKIMIEESIALGSANVNSANNYMQVTGGDGNYSYEWRVSGEEVFSEARNPTVSPTSNTNYELVVSDSRGSEARSNMTIIVEKGSIEITNLIEGINFKDSNRMFDIFINGPDGSLYTLSLKNGESKTIGNLKAGHYTVSTIVPMNYKLLGITNKSITVSLDDKDHKTTIKNIRTNYSWFYSESLF